MALDDVKFAGTGTWGSGLGRPLTRAEADGNVYELREAIQGLIDDPTPGVGISNITVTGRQFTVYLTDASTLGPFDLPMVNPRFRGVWASSINYAAYDIVRVGGFGTYMVVQDHTSASTFDPYVADTNGNFYVQIGPDPFYTPQLLDVSGASLDLTLTHQNKYIRSTNVGGLTVNLNAGVFPANAEITFRQAAAGAITVVTGSGVNINLPETLIDAATSSIGEIFTLKRVLNDTGERWDFISGGSGGGAEIWSPGSVMDTSIIAVNEGYDRCFYNCITETGTEFVLPSGLPGYGIYIRFRQGSAGAVTFSTDTAGTITPTPGKLAQSSGLGAVVHVQNIGDEWFLWGDLADAP